MTHARGLRRSLLLALVMGVAVCASFLAWIPECKRVTQRAVPRPVADSERESHR